MVLERVRRQFAKDIPCLELKLCKSLVVGVPAILVANVLTHGAVLSPVYHIFADLGIGKGLEQLITGHISNAAHNISNTLYALSPFEHASAASTSDVDMSVVHQIAFTDLDGDETKAVKYIQVFNSEDTVIGFASGPFETSTVKIDIYGELQGDVHAKLAIPSEYGSIELVYTHIPAAEIQTTGYIELGLDQIDTINVANQPGQKYAILSLENVRSGDTINLSGLQLEGHVVSATPLQTLPQTEEEIANGIKSAVLFNYNGDSHPSYRWSVDTGTGLNLANPTVSDEAINTQGKPIISPTGEEVGKSFMLSLDRTPPGSGESGAYNNVLTKTANYISSGLSSTEGKILGTLGVISAGALAIKKYLGRSKLV